MSESQKWESQSRALKIAWGAMLLNEAPHGWRGAFFWGANFSTGMPEKSIPAVDLDRGTTANGDQSSSATNHQQTEIPA
jgi:hypothetical protein